MPCNNQSCGIQVPASANRARECQTTERSAAPCKAPSYSRACLAGDPAASPTQIARASRLEALWTRRIEFAVVGAGPRSLLQALFPTFTASGGACVKTVSLIRSPVGGGPDEAIPLTIVGIGAVWDFTDATQAWSSRVALPCRKHVIDIVTTTGRCNCDVDCEGCLYPEAVGGLFSLQVEFPTVNFLAGDVLTFEATGHHAQSEPCCTMPVLLDEPVPVAGPYPAVQNFS